MIESKKSELKNDLKETNQQIYELIEQANQQLQQLFNKREEELLKLYKQEMLNVQRQLVKIRDEESQTEIEKRIQKHREELAKERELYLERSIKLSENIKELGKIDRDIRQSFNELQSEIKFLDEQLIYADKHNIILQEELNSLGEEEQQIQSQIRRQPKSMQQLQSVRLMPLPQIKRNSYHLQQEQELNAKLKQQINQVEEFQESELERCFDEALITVTEQSDASTNIDLTCCNDFSEYSKRRIFEDFLEKPYVRGKIPKCQICQKGFSKVTTREHMCKRCLRVVCSSCSPFKIQFELNKGRRLCKICKEESDQIKSFVDSNHIQYGFDTLSKQWLGNAFNSQEYKSVRDSTKIKIDQMEFAGLDNINYSLKDFYSLVGKDNVKLQNVCMTFCSKNPDIKLTAEMVCLTNFLLCFSSEASAFQLLNIIYRQKPPEECLISIVTYCVKGFNLPESEIIFLRQFLEARLKRYLLTFSINMFNFDTTLFLISQLIQKYDNFIRGLSAIFMLVSPNLRSSTHEDLEIYILREIKKKDVEIKYKTMKQPQPKQDSENKDRTQSIISLAFSTFEQQDNTQVNDLKTEISNLKLQLSLKDNEIESYKFQLSQLQIPDQQKKDKFLQQKCDEIAILLSKIDELTLENQLYQKKERTNSDFSLMYSQSQKIIEEKQKQIDRLKAKVKEGSLDNRTMSLSLAGGVQSILSGKEVQEMKQSFEEEKQLLLDQIKQLESSKALLQKSLDAQKKLNQRVIDYIGSMTLNNKLIELQVKTSEEKETISYKDEINNLIDIKNQQNQMLSRLQNTNLQQIEELKVKIKNSK
ncbi:unnamed protein product [Paramecium pentaurelia]|uniref:FYVE-type domain-containing protein n=1 Tax=Paramecium pentaurelia TaxID=43138 RepID=A0A8S1T0X3_9CILI|nr:unnamed protein product [Paramecium pentaurelia]